MAMMSASYSAAEPFHIEPTTIGAALPQVWGFWATLGWFGVAVLTIVISYAAYFCGFFAWSALAHPDGAHGQVLPVLVNLSYVTAMSAAGLVLASAARSAGWSAREYFGLLLPKPRQILIVIAMFAGILIVLGVIGSFLPPSEPSTAVKNYSEMMDNGAALFLYWLGLVVVAPVVEEVAFRGFLFRGFSQSKVGPVGAIVLTSMIWAASHTQYAFGGMTLVFCGGLVLGTIRWRAGSTTLTILLHATWNLMVTAAAATSV